MPAPPLVPDVYRTTNQGHMFSHTVDHVVHWHVPLTGSVTHLDVVNSLASHEASSWLTAMQPSICPSWVQEQTRCVYLGDLSVPEGVHILSGAGTSGFAQLPAYAAATVRHTFPGRGRGKDGRTNIPAVPIPFMDTADCYHLTASAVSQYESDFTAYVGGVVSGVLMDLGVTPVLVILDRKLGTWAIPLASTVDPYLNVHRRWAKRLARH